ncbi:hypothetical protein GCM10009629_38820 [Pseudonocardia alni]
MPCRGARGAARRRGRRGGRRDVGCAPGTGPVEATAERARDHGLNWLVTGLEQLQCAVDAPSEGGTPAGGIPRAPGALSDPATTPPVAAGAGSRRSPRCPGGRVVRS